MSGLRVDTTIRVTLESARGEIKTLAKLKHGGELETEDAMSLMKGIVEASICVETTFKQLAFYLDELKENGVLDRLLDGEGDPSKTYYKEVMTGATGASVEEVELKANPSAGGRS